VGGDTTTRVSAKQEDFRTKEGVSFPVSFREVRGANFQKNIKVPPSSRLVG